MNVCIYACMNVFRYEWVHRLTYLHEAQLVFKCLNTINNDILNA